MHRIRTSLSYANVMATVAVFVALGGSSYAAVTLSKNSVKSKHIAKAQVKRSDIRKNAVTSGKVKNFSLLARDFAAGQLPAGPPGPKGDKGDTGAAGPFLDTLPSGKSEKGAYIMRGTAAAASHRDGADISFAIPLAAAPTAHFLDAGQAPTTECPGTAAAPSAAAGHLCIYEGFNINMTNTSFQDPVTASTGSTVRPYGAVVVGLSTAAGAYISSGGWAVTAP